MRVSSSLKDAYNKPRVGVIYTVERATMDRMVHELFSVMQRCLLVGAFIMIMFI